MKAFSVLWPVGLLLTGCVAPHLPSSNLPGIYSTTTGRRVLPDSLAARYPGWPDDRVLFFDRRGCTDSLRMVPLTYDRVAAVSKATKADRLPTGPGVLAVANDGLCLDEAEIPNREWRQYVLAQQQAGLAPAPLLPNPAALPVADYYSNHFYDYYPVVGISYEQAQAFCRWRSRVVGELYRKSSGPVDTLASNYYRITYRLPTEAEWESAALVASNLSFGTSCLQLPVRVAPQAAAYLRQRSGSPQPAEAIKAEIIAYNATHPTRYIINCVQEGPAFLAGRTPGYVYQGPPNGFGLYQMLGNVAELVQEKGITKGGSYRDALAACRIKARGTYQGPAPHIGFRAAFTITFPNR